jgi:hypothetical protein
VTYIVQRYASLAALLYVLALLLYVRARLTHLEDGRASSRVIGLSVASVVAAAAAMNTKEISLTLPLVVAGYELLFFGARRRFALVLPIAATALFPLLDPMVGQHLATEAPLSPVDYALTQTRVVATYLRLLVLPVGQNLDHDVSLSRSVAEPTVLVSSAVLIAVAALGGYVLVRARRIGRIEGLLVGGGIAWFFVTLAVESSVIPIRDIIWEHRVYLPGAGAAVAFGTSLLVCVERLRLRGPPRLQAAVALLLVAAPLGVATWRRNLVWTDDVALWADAVAKSPAKARPHQFLGTALSERGDQDGAQRELEIAVRLEPEYHEALFNLGNVYLMKKQLPQAMAAFMRAT